MKTLRFTETFAATPEEVWHAMLDLDSYREWTAAFSEGSTYVGGWNQGDKIRFIDPSGDGMMSEIAESRPYSYVSIRHLGMIKDGVEDTEGEEARKWAQAYENYSFTPNGAGTELEVTLDVTPEHEQMMQTMWRDALARLKGIVETRRVESE
jgi:hypothetical protein